MKEFYYILSDSDKNNYISTSLKNSEVDLLLKKVSAKLLIKMVDACNSGTRYIKDLKKSSCWDEDNQELQDKNTIITKEYLKKTIKELGDVIFLFSSHRDQPSIATPNISAFTKSFILALNEDIGYKIIWSEIIDKINKFFLKIKNGYQKPYFVTQCGTPFFCSISNNLKRIIDKFLKPTKNKIPNPFKHNPPEGLTIQEYHKIFVKEPSEIEQIKRNQDNIIMGSQGSGKSMLLLYLEINHQLFLNGCSFPEYFLEEINDFLGISVHIVNDRLNVMYYENLSENRNLEDIIISSICMTDLILVIVSNILLTCTVWPIKDYLNSLEKENVKNFYNQISKLIENNETIDEDQNNFQIFKKIEEKLSKIRKNLMDFCLKRITNKNTKYLLPSYNHTFLGSFIKEFKDLMNIKEIPIYILIDNADYGCKFTHNCLNSLIRIRYQKDYCFKLAVQRGKLWDLHDLDNMNDYHLFTIDEINTNDNSIYLKKIERITESRLKISGINKNGYEFFPIYDKEEKLYKKIVNEMKEDLGKKYEKLLIKERRVTEEKYKANRISKYARTHLFHECKPYNYA